MGLGYNPAELWCSCCAYPDSLLSVGEEVVEEMNQVVGDMRLCSFWNCLWIVLNMEPKAGTLVAVPGESRCWRRKCSRQAPFP